MAFTFLLSTNASLNLLGGPTGALNQQLSLLDHFVLHVHTHTLHSEYMALDPTLSEEVVMDGRMIIGMNVHREICAVQMIGGVVILPDQVCITGLCLRVYKYYR